MSPDFYAILGVTPEADAAQIKGAFRRLARTLHPDATPDAAGPSEPERLAQVIAAWHVLNDPAKRAAYDRTRTQDRPNRAASPCPEGENPGREPRDGDAALVAGPTRIHDSYRPQPGPHIRAGPPIRLGY